MEESRGEDLRLDRSLIGVIAIAETTGAAKNAESSEQASSAGIGHWMQVTLQLCEEARPKLSEAAVHDLRVAIRRCRSMAEEFAQLDPDPGWGQLRSEGRKLFRDLGGLRDLQVMELWLAQLAPPDDRVRLALEELLRRRQEEEKRRARKAISRFNRKKWTKLAKRLTLRAERFPIGGPAFLHQALQRWEGAYALHRLAMRDRSKVAFHRLRIGLKRFRYTIENFLPELHRSWRVDLKELQDHLGEIHDLDVLWSILPEAGDAFDRLARQLWRKRVVAARQLRVVAYRRRMIGPKSLWSLWRADLPNGHFLEEASLAKLTSWAVHRDPASQRAHRIEDIATRLYDLLGPEIDGAPFDKPRWRTILRAGAFLQDAGRSFARKKRPKGVAKHVLQTDPPLTWTRKDLQAAAQVLRCAGTADPDKLDAWLADQPSPRRRAILTLAALLRLARTLEKRGLTSANLLAAESRGGEAIALRLRVPEQTSRLFLELGARKSLLEWACRRPIILELKDPRPAHPDPPSSVS